METVDDEEQYPQGFAKHYRNKMEDKLAGTGLPAHGLMNLDVSWVLALPLYLYVKP